MLAHSFVSYCLGGNQYGSTVMLAAMVRAITLSYGRPQTLNLGSTKTPKPIATKFCTLDNVGELLDHDKSDNDRLREGAPTHR
jgi:hypothetical protein